MLGMNHTVAMRIALLLGEASTCQKSKANANVAHVPQRLLEPTVAATPKVPCCPVGATVLPLVPIEDTLEKGLLP